MKNHIWTAFLLPAILFTGCQSTVKPPALTVEPPVITIPLSVLYKNDAYGFTFSLPEDWRNYRIETTEWKTVNDRAPGSGYGGPMIIIHPYIIPGDIPYQEIPVMVMTYDEWNLLDSEKIEVSAGGIPSELFRNSRFVFVLPPRYNAADSIDTEEVELVIKANTQAKSKN